VAVRLAIDTNRYTDFARGDEHALERLRHAERVYLSFVVLGELRAGFLCGSRSERNEANLTRFLDSPRVDVLYPDEQTTHQYARLFRQLRAQGTPIPTNDLWTAALAVQHGLHLFARDRHFDHLPQIPRV
jgi:tRNA(fMet)-specific endonuclease VapC